jgi:hypothetical protein
VLRCSDAGGVMTLVHASPAWYLLSGSGPEPFRGWLVRGASLARGARIVLGAGAEFWDLFVVVGAVDGVDRMTSAQVATARRGVDGAVDGHLLGRSGLCTTGCRSQGVHPLALVGPPRHAAPPQPSTSPVEKWSGDSCHLDLTTVVHRLVHISWTPLVRGGRHVETGDRASPGTRRSDDPSHNLWTGCGQLRCGLSGTVA